MKAVNKILMTYDLKPVWLNKQGSDKVIVNYRKYHIQYIDSEVKIYRRSSGLFDYCMYPLKHYLVAKGEVYVINSCTTVNLTVNLVFGVQILIVLGCILYFIGLIVMFSQGIAEGCVGFVFVLIAAISIIKIINFAKEQFASDLKIDINKF